MKSTTIYLLFFIAVLTFSALVECASKVNLRKKKNYAEEDNQSKLEQQIAEATEPEAGEVEKQIDEPENAKKNQSTTAANTNSSHVKFGKAFEELLELGKKLKTKEDLKSFLEKVVRFKKALDLHNKELIKIMAINNKILNATYAKILSLKKRVHEIDEKKKTAIFVPGTYSVSWYSNQLTYYTDVSSLLVRTASADWWCCYDRVYTYFKPFISSYFYYSTRIVNLDTYYHLSVNSDPLIVFNSFWSSPVCCYYSHYYYSVPTYWVNWVSPWVYVPAVTSYRWIESTYETVTTKIETFMESKGDVKKIDESVKKLEETIKDTNKELNEKEKTIEKDIATKKDGGPSTADNKIKEDSSAKTIEKVANDVMDTIKETEEEEKTEKRQPSPEYQKPTSTDTKREDSTLKDVINEVSDDSNSKSNTYNNENTEASDESKDKDKSASNNAGKGIRELLEDSELNKKSSSSKLDSENKPLSQENLKGSQKPLESTTLKPSEFKPEAQSSKEERNPEGVDPKEREIELKVEDKSLKKKKKCTELEKKRGLCRDEEEGAEAEVVESERSNAGGLLKSDMHSQFRRKTSSLIKKNFETVQTPLYAAGDNELYKEIIKAEVEKEKLEENSEKKPINTENLTSMFNNDEMYKNLDVSVFS